MAGGLSRALNAPGGIDASEACARAAKNLESVRDQALDTVRDCLADILTLTREGPPAPEIRRELHRLSCTIAGLGGMFQLDALSKVAYSFCRYIDESAPGWDKEAARLHVDAMRLLEHPGEAAAETQAKIVEGLAKVRRAVV